MQRLAYHVLCLIALVWASALWCSSAIAQEPCGSGVCGGGLQCLRCPGNEPTCARPPAVCCGSGMCGDGLQCLSCPGREPTCARPPAVCCGSGMCGGGLRCVNTPQGPECQIPAAATPPSTDTCGGAGPCGGGLQCARCPGSPPTCARPPFQCCGTAGICGDGLQCATCPGSPPTCARPPVQCCGSAGACGGGLVCATTPRGPECQAPGASSPPQGEICGSGVCGGGLVCMRCPGREPTCARPPAQCCGGGICGDGLQCLNCAGQEPTCARPPAQCCGGGICGGGLVCAQTPRGPECQLPGASPQTQSDPCGSEGPCGGGLQCARCPGSPSTCARPPFQCCGSAGVCGDGLVCVPTAPGGPVCARPSPSTPSQSTSGPIPPGVPTQGQFRSRWDQVGGSWTTGWVPNHPFQGCIHGITCSCGAENYCGNYANGQTTTAWPQGCGGPRWTIRCTSEVQPPSGAQQAPPATKAPVHAPQPAKPQGFLGDGDGPWFCCQWLHPVFRKTTCAPAKNRSLCASYDQGKAVDNAACIAVGPDAGTCK